MTLAIAHPYTGFVRWFSARSPLRWPPAVLAASAAAVLAVATDVSAYEEPPSLHSLIPASELIVVGKIVRTAQVERDNDLQDVSYNGKKRYIAVVATLNVEETLLGDAPGAAVKLVFPKRARVQGEPVYDSDQDGIWLLRKSERQGEYIADEIGRFQPRERKEQIKAIIAKFSIKDLGGGTAGDSEDAKPSPSKP